MRVLLHQGRPAQLTLMSPGAMVATVALITSGDLAMLPDGCIAEPVEVFDTEDVAHEHRKRMLRENPAEDFRVVLNADVSV